MTRLRRIPPRRLAVFTVGSPVDDWASIAVGFPRYEFRIHPAISETDRTVFAGPQTVLVRAQATPAPYESNHANQFSHIHFLAHGTASRLSPLDSAIVLWKDAENSESFKLYARKIKHLPLHADLSRFPPAAAPASVSTLAKDFSAWHGCLSAGGTQAVIAASWGQPTPQHSNSWTVFYDSVNQGTTPDVALRKALSPCSILIDHFARPVPGLPSNSMRNMRDHSSIL